jgi:O-antigen ligase
MQKKVKQQSKSNAESPVRWIFGGLAVITLYFQTNLNDPFNSPKMWILVFVAAWLMGYIISFKRIVLANKSLKTLFYILVAFTSSALFASIFTDFKYVAVFGDTQRRNGLISYLSLAIILFASSIFVRVFNIKWLYTTTCFVGLITAIYAFMQTSGRDFVKWNNNYNAIIGTLGNPNFAAALMAVMGVLIFTSILITDFKIYTRICAAALAIVLLGLIYRSNARQGLLSYILGVGFFLIIWIYIKNRRLGLAGATSGIIVFIFSVLGMLQIGPLEQFLYKPSVSVRGHYWRTGIEMFKAEPLFGIGMDRYGAYFKEFREVSYPLSYGFDITSTNAHNTFIQFFATGGAFFGVSYLILNGYILNRAIFGLKNLSGNNQLLLAGIFSAWIAFHAQSLVSIDNIGISIWGWVLGGSIIGLSVSSSTEVGEDRKQLFGKRNNVNLSRVLISGIFGLAVAILVALLYRGERDTYTARGLYSLDNIAARESYKVLQLNSTNVVLNDPSYSLNLAMNLAENGFIDEGIEVITKLHINDPRNQDAITALALIYESTGKILDAIEYRLKIVKLDPWNAVNYLQLGKNYKAQGDLMKSREMFEKILSFSTGAVGTPIAEQARKELSE